MRNVASATNGGSVYTVKRKNSAFKKVVFFQTSDRAAFYSKSRQRAQTPCKYRKSSVPAIGFFFRLRQSHLNRSTGLQSTLPNRIGSISRIDENKLFRIFSHLRCTVIRKIYVLLCCLLRVSSSTCYEINVPAGNSKIKRFAMCYL